MYVYFCIKTLEFGSWPYSVLLKESWLIILLFNVDIGDCAIGQRFKVTCLQDLLKKCKIK